jgi:two-component system sensor histidine kinase DevS
MVTLTREQLEDRLAALHRASLELVQDISLDTLLERIVTLARDQVGARYAALGVLDESGALEQFIPVGMAPEEIAKVEHYPRGLGLIGVLMHTRETIRIPEISEDPRSVGFPPNHPPMHSMLGVPIYLGERQLGQLYLTDKIGAEEFTPDDQQVIETLAAYAAVAISNARLYRKLIQREKDLLRRNEDLALLNNLASSLASSGEIDEILQKVLAHVVDLPGVEAAEFFLRDEDSKVLRMVLHRGKFEEHLWRRDRFEEGEGLIGATVKSGEPRFLVLPTKNSRYLRKDVIRERIHQLACFPLTTRAGTLGALCIAFRQSEPIDELEVQFLTAISSWAGTSIESVRLKYQGRRLAILEERERIGMDLHDGIIQSIYAVGLTLEHARLLLNEDTVQARRRIDQAVEDLNSTIRDIRTYILDLRPRQLHEENLMEGLRRLVNELKANTLLEASLHGPPDGLPQLPDSHALALFHICQEGLANVAKHAHASKVEVYLWATPERAILEISDDGIGFDTQKVTMTLGHGLANMQTRARSVGGDIEITSEPGGGTTLLVWVPFNKQR